MVRAVQLIALIIPLMLSRPALSPSHIRQERHAAEEQLIRAMYTEKDPVLSYYGECRITFYCPCSRCCGKSDGITASGTKATANHTVAATLPFGTRLMIEDKEYVVEDRGVGDMQIDIYVDSHDEALRRGLYYTEVYLIE